MGVHGLTTWVNRRSTLGAAVLLKAGEPGTSRPTPLVIDALAFMYHTSLKETIRGGDYQQYQATLEVYVATWRAVALEPIFVFDGSFEATKLDTALQRSNSRLQRGINYMRGSEEERSKNWVQNKAERLPMLMRSAVIETLHQQQVRALFAEGEADACTAELASRLNGYAVSGDSDYFIYPNVGKGYVPLTSMEYGKLHTPHLSARYPTIGPASLAFKAYKPEETARLLSIPPTFLPLLAALVGNDQSDFAHMLLSSSQRPRFRGQMEGDPLESFARALAKFAHLPASSPREIENIFRSILPTFLGNRLVEDSMVNCLVDSALSYELEAIETTSPTFPLHPNSHDTPQQAAARAQLIAGFRKGHVRSFILNFLKHGLVDPAQSLEDPDAPSPFVVFGSIIRLWIYAILAHDLWIPREIITEHTRQGTQLVATKIPLPSVSQMRMLSCKHSIENMNDCFLTQPLAKRFKIFLQIMNAPEALMNSNSSNIIHNLPLILALRWINANATESRRWSQSTVVAALLTSILLVHRSTSTSSPFSFSSSKVHPQNYLPPLPRKAFIQLSSELVNTLFHISVLSETLLLTGTGLVTEPHAVFDGSLFHVMLELGEDQLEGVVRGLPAEFRDAVQELLPVIQT
ncbi:PIN domain-like protein [Meredithblackwellia eburnea MCA 4105]